MAVIFEDADWTRLNHQIEQMNSSLSQCSPNPKDHVFSKQEIALYIPTNQRCIVVGGFIDCSDFFNTF